MRLYIQNKEGIEKTELTCYHIKSWGHMPRTTPVKHANQNSCSGFKELVLEIKSTAQPCIVGVGQQYKLIKIIS